MPDLVPALDRPIPTADKRVAAYRQGLAQRGGMAGLMENGNKSYTFKPVDTLALSRQYGMENASAPRWLEGTFQAPLQATWQQYEKIRDDAMTQFIGTMTKRGFTVLANEGYRPRVSPGVYPAHDLMDGYAVLDRREFIIGMWFTFRNPKPIRLELPPHLLQEYTVKSL